MVIPRFYSEYNSIPGAIEDHVEPDIGKLRNCAVKVRVVKTYKADMQYRVFHLYLVTEHSLLTSN